MPRFLPISIFLLFYVESTRSLLPNAIRELTGLDSKANRFVLPVHSNGTAPDPFANISEPCKNAFLGLMKPPFTQLVRCKYDLLWKSFAPFVVH